jgi:hypothetical protein
LKIAVKKFSKKTASRCNIIYFASNGARCNPKTGKPTRKFLPAKQATEILNDRVFIWLLINIANRFLFLIHLFGFTR